jgi:hypothetical protein
MQSIVQRFVSLSGRWVVALAIGWFGALAARSLAEDAEAVQGDAFSTKKLAALPKMPEPVGAKRLSTDYDVWLDPKAKAVIVDGHVSLRVGMLEMFACTRNTKEHESIVSANTKAYLVHAGLLSLGAEPGHPVQFLQQYLPPSGVWVFDLGMTMVSVHLPPVFIPAAGTEIDVQVQWLDERGKAQSARAQEWVRDIRTGKAMTYPFVFAGSGFWIDPETGKQYYKAEAGDFICVSNFSTAMLDIPVRSSQDNTELAFEAYTARIPPLGAPVRLILKPKLNLQRTPEGSREPQRVGR